ncbi:uncharacterized protein LOC112588719 [Harpegnathos saltator]|uniref:uncharacterized protein LOC112588719 n=1 Tax=Harpegnathos saltator TaxID=610380 RepID=UPI000DBEE5B9|nr:uncharacterized protein LOC112588719 [Harpegnathos saltator]
MAELTTKQLQLKRVIDRTINNIKKIGKNNLTAGKVRSRLTILKDTWSQFLDGHALLTKATPEASRGTMDYFRDHYCDATEEVFEAAHDFLTECLEELEPVSSYAAGHSSQSRAHSVSLPHLLPIRLPPFEGRYEEWEQFRDRFTALIISNRDLDDFARMHYLTSCVKGRALECIGNIPVTADNFSTAWQALLARYKNKRRLITKHLSALLNLKTISRESVADLQALHDDVNIAVASLHTLHRSPADLWNDILVHIVSNKLDPVTRKAWNVRMSESSDPPTFEALNLFLASRTRALEEFAANSSSVAAVKSSPASRVHVAAASTHALGECPICKGRHYFSACPTFVRGNVFRRRDLVKRYQRCYNCLSPNHAVNECSSKHSCRVCLQRHHSLLHAGADSGGDRLVVEPNPGLSSQAVEAPCAVQSLHASSIIQSIKQVLLATAWVRVIGSSGRTVVVRALLDQGSQMTFVSENLAQVLHAKRQRISVQVSAVGGVHAGTVRYATDISVSPRDSMSPSYNTSAAILERLTHYAPKYVESLSGYPHLVDLPWADPNPTSSDPINLIIGCDLYNVVTLAERREGRFGEPTAQNSIFGWFLSGPIAAPAQHVLSPDGAVEAIDAFSVFVHHCCDMSILAKEIQQFWEIEELPKHSVLSTEDIQCEDHFRSTHSRTIEGRYVVRLPFKTSPPLIMGDTRVRAARQLDSLTRRLQAHPAQFAEYSAFLAEYEHLGHMRRAPVTAASVSRAVYIPHHPVYRSDSKTSHLRVVFNASSRTATGRSLNDNLLSGPKLQTDLPAVILRWRIHKFVYSADIAKMYRQIWVDEQDVDYQRILWNTDRRTDYQLLTVTYGMACAPFLALRVIHQLAEDEGSRFPLAVPLLRNDIYVDDLLFGDGSRDRLLQVRRQLDALLQCGGFQLRKWASNSSELLADIDAHEHGLAYTKSLQVDEKLKILGIGWNPTRDNFKVTVSLEGRVPESKRAILAAIARIYDPLGWVTPITITAKIFMQLL